MPTTNNVEPTKTATEELRRMLDERGVEWHDTKIGKGFITVFEHDGITWVVTEHSSGRLSVKGSVKPTQGHYDGMTPAQAIAATLGRGTCHITDNGPWGYPYVCSECGASFDADVNNGEFNYCPNCGARCVW